MTRYQVWKARERARFRFTAESARLRRLYPHAVLTTDVNARDFDRWMDAAKESLNARIIAAYVGIKEPFLG